MFFNGIVSQNISPLKNNLKSLDCKLSTLKITVRLVILESIIVPCTFQKTLTALF